ncbi:hypothetical protein Thiowin_00461 [Thiorhodovibrio winogradskyi]|uniref:Uncharacterized protein n=1 Tax=Thiorhodovibrio winogradskyi TaxID=77007 RepID=A0ABZ0S303_9GAMM
MQGLANLSQIATGIDHRKIPAQHEVTVAARGGLAADSQGAKQGIKLPGAGQIVIILQRRQPGGFAEAARAQKKQLLAGGLQRADTLSAISVVVAVGDDFVKVSSAVRKFHGG